ncbi:glycosyltransferase [Belliella sp. R4-6]|uniref:Glycosyltransferase n=1 Tax=Belliella alkalica TaxID=1730871 RepID=A0ABS9VHW1_9BACT|nr:glycosyltransferase [Belliella alkalica]MCH7415764.1 glycosyltransferase [Belliella alkalica]
MNNSQQTNKTEPRIKGIDFKPFIEPELDARYYLQLPPDKVVITMISPLKKDQGHCLFLRMASNLVKKYHNAHFLIAHEEIDFEFQREFSGLIENKNLEGKLDIIKNIKGIPDILKATDIFVYLKEKGDEFPTVILKAMATGLPVVSIKTSLFQKVILHEETGFLIENNDIESAIQKISLLMENPNMSKKMGKLGQERIINHFSN